MKLLYHAAILRQNGRNNREYRRETRCDFLVYDVGVFIDVRGNAPSFHLPSGRENAGAEGL